ncbi:MAG: ImmA/IrrE family metallo-endopeptidase [Rickettsiales bacterium]|nr:ImmA/IrrE family metallo-endopeptidase [Rickettsiales bacterium]
MEKGVSFRSSEIIERKVDKILQKAKEKGFYNFDSATPIDLIIEKLFRLKIGGFVDLNKEFTGVLGALDLDNKMMWIDESLNHIDSPLDFTKEARCNFTIAHELGHYVFHKPQYKEAKNLALFHDSSDPRTEALEMQANKFASFILMPRTVMLKQWHEIDHTNYSAQHAIDEMKKFFKVSREAMVYRLKFLGLLDPGY